MPPQISSALRRQASDAAGPHAQPQVFTCVPSGLDTHTSAQDQLLCACFQQQHSADATPKSQMYALQAAAMAAWVPDSGAEDVGGSKAAAARRGGGPAAVEAELDALQRGMLASWQGRQPTPAPLGAQVAGWQAQLEGLESRAQVCWFTRVVNITTSPSAPRGVVLTI